MITVHIDTSDARKLLDKMLVGADGLAVFYKKHAIDILKEQSSKYWDNRQGAWGDPWGTSLYVSGDLERSIQNNNNYVINKNTLKQQSDLVYAPTHFFGLTLNNLFGKGISHKFQERPFAGLDDQGMEKVLDKLCNFVLTGK
jgi:phage gpG-like protein